MHYPCPLPIRVIKLSTTPALPTIHRNTIHRNLLLGLAAGGDLNMSDPFPSPIRVMNTGVAAVAIGGSDTCIILRNQSGERAHWAVFAALRTCPPAALMRASSCAISQVRGVLCLDGHMVGIAAWLTRRSAVLIRASSCTTRQVGTPCSLSPCDECTLRRRPHLPSLCPLAHRVGFNAPVALFTCLQRRASPPACGRPAWSWCPATTAGRSCRLAMATSAGAR